VLGFALALEVELDVVEGVVYLLEGDFWIEVGIPRSLGATSSYNLKQGYRTSKSEFIVIPAKKTHFVWQNVIFKLPLHPWKRSGQ
jgi:hypothetical protein